MRALFTASFLALALAGTGCVGNAICAKRQECNDRLEEDSEGVCVAEYDRNIDSLRANDEEECQRLADAILALDGCAAQLDCDDFLEADLGEKCEDEQDDLNDAFDDAFTRGEFECGASE